MLKLINSLILILFLISCGKDKIAPIQEGGTYELTSDYAFIEGEWKWKQSIINWSITAFQSYSGDKFFVRQEQVSEFCTLKFSHDCTLDVITQSGTTTHKLRPYGAIQIGVNRIVHFKTASGAVFTFSWSSSLNRLDTETTFFTFPAHPCNTGFFILNNSYEKV